jgi:hypothetical protein
MRKLVGSTLLVCGVFVVVVCGAHAQAGERAGQVLIAVGAHLTTPVDETCVQMGDVVECSTLRFYAGGDVGGLYYLTDWFALGARLAGSADLDASRNVSSLGETEEHSQWLWRLAAEARLQPAFFPLWFSGALGGALVSESFEEKSQAGAVVMDGSATQQAFLLGVGTGIDLLLGERLVLAIEAHLQVLSFGDDPPQLSASAEATEFGAAPWLTLGVRLGYRF